MFIMNKVMYNMCIIYITTRKFKQRWLYNMYIIYITTRKFKQRWMEMGDFDVCNKKPPINITIKGKMQQS
jgi:hypothetical protein